MNVRRIVGLVILSVLIICISGCIGWWLFAYFQPAEVSISSHSEKFPLKSSWERDLGVLVYGPLVYGNNNLFVSGYDIFGTIFWYRVDPATGAVVWSKAVSYLGHANYFRCLSQGLLVISGPWNLMMLNILDGGKVWSDFHSNSTVICHQGTLFSSGVPRDSISAFDLSTLEDEWTSTNPKMSFYGMVYNHQADELIATHGEDFYRIDPKTGNVGSSFPEARYPPNYGDSNYGPLYVVDQNQLFIGGTVQNATTGELIHKEDYTPFPPTITTDTMYLSTKEEGIIAFDREDFSKKWQYLPSEPGQLESIAPIAIYQQVGYALFSDNTLHAIDLEAGQYIGHLEFRSEIEWPRPICSSVLIMCDQPVKASLVASEDTLFVSVGNGRIYAFE